jgi:hypothetical protein
MRCQCYGRLINLRTNVVVAAYGWLKEPEQHGKYWVSIEDDPYLYFNTKREARAFFEIASERLRTRKRFQMEHRRTLAALAGGKEIVCAD